MSNTPKISLVVPAFLGLLFLGTAFGDDCVIDDFEDGELFDGSPFEWDWPLFPGVQTIEDGKLILRNLHDDPPSDDPVILYLPEFEGWYDLRVKCQMDGAARIGLGSNMTFSYRAYFATILSTNGELALHKYWGPNVEDGRELASEAGVADPLAVHQLEFVRIGDRLEVRQWEVGGEPPEVHTVAAIDAQYVDGFPGIYFWGREPGARGIFYDFEICYNKPPVFRRGDSNDDGAVDIADPVHILGWLFTGGSAPGCLAAIDVNGDGDTNIADPIYLLSFLFLGGPSPVAPYPDCGSSDLATDEELGCESQHANCQ